MMSHRTALLAVLGLASSAAPSFAGWNNVFLTGCWSCPPRTAQRPPAPAPRAETHVEYERTSYSVPVTVMKPEKYTEEVPVQVRSYYYEPVTTYRTSYTLDECGQCQQVQVPCRTSQVRREYTETVMKAVERVRMVPVQMERIVTEERPKYTTTHYGPIKRTTTGLQPVGPTVDQYRDRDPLTPSVPGTIPPANVPMRMPGGDVSKPRQPAPASAPSQSAFRPNAMTTSFSKATGGTLTGEVVKNDKETPIANAKLVFVNAKNLDAREYATADGYGQFDAKLPAGDWHLYLGHGDGKAVYHSKVSVTDGERTAVKVQDR
jgi:hypothetical protein